MRQDNLGPPLVQISATTLVYVSFLVVTVAARHLLRSTCLCFPPPLSRRWANYPTTFTFIGVLGSSFAPLLFRLEAVKPHVPFIFPFSDHDFRIAFSFISITPPSFLYGISASTTVYYIVSPIIRHCACFNALERQTRYPCGIESKGNGAFSNTTFTVFSFSQISTKSS